MRENKEKLESLISALIERLAKNLQSNNISEKGFNSLEAAIRTWVMFDFNDSTADLKKHLVGATTTTHSPEIPAWMQEKAK